MRSHVVSVDAVRDLLEVVGSYLGSRVLDSLKLDAFDTVESNFQNVHMVDWMQRQLCFNLCNAFNTLR